MYGRATSNFQPGYLGKVVLDKKTTKLASQGLEITGTLLSKGITARGDRKLEQEKRKTARATRKYDVKIEASKSKSAAAQAQAAEAETASRKAESIALTTKYAVYGSVGIAALIAGVLIVKTFRR